jgi:hypothetical protein
MVVLVAEGNGVVVEVAVGIVAVAVFATDVSVAWTATAVAVCCTDVMTVGVNVAVATTTPGVLVNVPDTTVLTAVGADLCPADDSTGLWNQLQLALMPMMSIKPTVFKSVFMTTSFSP